MQAIKTVARDGFLPAYQHEGDAGADVRTTEAVTLEPFERKRVKLGFKLDIPRGYVGLLFPRSGQAAKRGLTFINCIGVVDAGYHGEVMAALVNISGAVVEVEEGERVGQLVVVPAMSPAFQPVPDESWFTPSERGKGGFGSTGRE